MPVSRPTSRCWITKVANDGSVFGNLATFFVLLLYVYASSIAFLAGVQADARTFEHMDPKLIGNSRDVLISELQANPAIDVAPLPMGKIRASVIHGLGHAVWAGSPNPEAAERSANSLLVATPPPWD